MLSIWSGDGRPVNTLNARPPPRFITFNQSIRFSSLLPSSVPTANPKRLTAPANRLILAPDERSLQVDLVRLDRTVPIAEMAPSTQVVQMRAILSSSHCNARRCIAISLGSKCAWHEHTVPPRGWWSSRTQRLLYLINFETRTLPARRCWLASSL